MCMNNALDRFKLQTSVIPAFVSVEKYSFQLMQLLSEQLLLKLWLNWGN